MSANDEEMFKKACFLTQLVASSVRVSETAGKIIKSIVLDGDLKIVNKGVPGEAQDLQTEADRSAQYCIEKSLQEKFNNRLIIIGEEDVTTEVEIRELNVSAEVLAIDQKCPNAYREIRPEDVVIWVDPLDGTSEFAQAAKNRSPLLQQITVLIGIAYKGEAVAGIIHQPYYNEAGRTIWGIKGVGAFGTKVSRRDNKRVVVTTRSHSTQMVQDTLDQMKAKNLADSVERVGGAGFKVIRCLEDACAYVFASGGCKKWDTAAPEAILVAAGGDLTDISGRRIYYGADVQHSNSGGVLATASWVEHRHYLDAVPEHIKEKLPEFNK